MAVRPPIQKYYLGPQAKFNELGLICESHKEVEFFLNQNFCEIKFKMTKQVKTTTQLMNCRDENQNLATENVFTQKFGDSLFFLVNFPVPGYYKFELYGLLADDEASSMPDVFNYLIRVDKAVKAVDPFPVQFAPWKDGCYLYEPLALSSSLPLDRVHFKVFIPNAKTAAIIVDSKDWNHMELKGDIFEGTFSLEKWRNKGVKVTMSANYGGPSKTYQTLLEYTL